MALFLCFGGDPSNTQTPTSMGYTSQERPFVPSVAPEDMEKGLVVGALTPRSVCPLDAEAVPFVPPKLPSWASKARGIDDATTHAAAHQQLLTDIGFLQLQQEHDDHEAMLDEAAEWLDSQEKILWGAPGVPPVVSDCHAIALAEQMPSTAVQEVKIVRVEPAWALASIAGQVCVYLPWGSFTNTEGPPGIKQSLLNRKPLRPHEFVLVEMEFKPQGRNLWRATKIFPKLPTEDMLTSVVQSTTNRGNACHFLPVSGFQYNYEVPLDPQNIGLIIGRQGSHLNSLIRGIQDSADYFWKNTKINFDENPLPEVTITPISAPEDMFNNASSFIPQKAHVRIYCPEGCEWSSKQVETLVSYFHS